MYRPQVDANGIRFRKRNVYGDKIPKSGVVGAIDFRSMIKSMSARPV